MRKALVIPFVILEFIIYVLIHSFDFTLEVGFRYLAIVFCSLFVLLTGKNFDGKLLTVAMILTVIADLFLLVIDNYYYIGVSVFCGVQLIYAYRLIKYNNIGVAGYIIIPLIGEIIAKIIFKENYDLLIFVTVIYLLTSVINIISSVIFMKRNYLFTLGLILLGACDVFVGINNLSAYIQFHGSGTIDYAWLFYIPSQVLIALSVNKNKKIA